eukprot:Rhum_TRINITY_DN15188_c1_g1::Rhum_TRINITY_DN15188_c1_g1_i1::g.142136::m.142136
MPDNVSQAAVCAQAFPPCGRLVGEMGRHEKNRRLEQNVRAERRANTHAATEAACGDERGVSSLICRFETTQDRNNILNEEKVWAFRRGHRYPSDIDSRKGCSQLWRRGDAPVLTRVNITGRGRRRSKCGEGRTAAGERGHIHRMNVGLMHRRGVCHGWLVVAPMGAPADGKLTLTERGALALVQLLCPGALSGRRTPLNPGVPGVLGNVPNSLCDNADGSQQNAEEPGLIQPSILGYLRHNSNSDEEGAGRNCCAGDDGEAVVHSRDEGSHCKAHKKEEDEHRSYDEVSRIACERVCCFHRCHNTEEKDHQ